MRGGHEAKHARDHERNTPDHPLSAGRMTTAPVRQKLLE